MSVENKAIVDTAELVELVQAALSSLESRQDDVYVWWWEGQTDKRLAAALKTFIRWVAIFPAGSHDGSFRLSRAGREAIQQRLDELIGQDPQEGPGGQSAGPDLLS